MSDGCFKELFNVGSSDGLRHVAFMLLSKSVVALVICRRVRTRGRVFLKFGTIHERPSSETFLTDQSQFTNSRHLTPCTRSQNIFCTRSWCFDISIRPNLMGSQESKRCPFSSIPINTATSRAQFDLHTSAVRLVCRLAYIYSNFILLLHYGNID